MPPLPTHGQEPARASVIIPVFNGGEFLERCLSGLARSDLTSFECIVIDDASTDDSAEIAIRYGAKLLRLDSRGGPARARNRGVREAQADIVIFFDADVCPHPDTVRRLLQHLDENPLAQAVMGSYDDAPTDPHFVAQYKNLMHHFVHQRSRTDAWTFWAGCGAVRRQAFLQVGGFDESFARPCIEDIELGARMHRRGWRLDLNPSIQVTHLKRWTLTNLLRTDIRDRAIPWLLLMLRQRNMPADLNVAGRHRASVAITVLLTTWLAMALPLPSVRASLPLVLLLASTALLALNADFYTFLWRKRGPWFALRSIPMHWFYYLYCGASVVVALLLHARDRATFATPRPGKHEPS